LCPACAYPLVLRRSTRRRYSTEDSPAAAIRLALPLDVVVIDGDGEITAFGFDASVDERAGAVIRPACHGEFEDHQAPNILP
jgi:hypothetical protein